uniref:Uncharacterized protein n=1 Tax=Ditylenchus dipsaci TaxID=166011 RepID=A0A915DIJ3_9BILA
MISSLKQILVISSFCLLCCLSSLFALASSNVDFPDYYKTANDIPSDLSRAGLSIDPTTNQVTLALSATATKSNPLTFALASSHPADFLIFSSTQPNESCFERLKNRKVSIFNLASKPNVRESSCGIVISSACNLVPYGPTMNSDYSDSRYHLNISVWTDGDCESNLSFNESFRLYNGYKKPNLVSSLKPLQKSNIGLIIGIVVASAVVLIFIIGAALYWFVYRPRAARKSEEKKEAHLQRVAAERSPSLKVFDKPSVRLQSKPTKLSAKPEEAADIMPSVSSQGQEQGTVQKESAVAVKSLDVPFIEPLIPSSFRDRTSEDNDKMKIETSELLLDKLLDQTQDDDSVSISATQESKTSSKKENRPPRVKADRRRERKMAADEYMPKRKKGKK